jgi:hypothetical protein
VTSFAEANDHEQKFEGLSCQRRILNAVEIAFIAHFKVAESDGEQLQNFVRYFLSQSFEESSTIKP